MKTEIGDGREAREKEENKREKRKGNDRGKDRKIRKEMRETGMEYVCRVWERRRVENR